ncbi:hypothetical protein C8F01DRAFT_359375 [Mycena amicta]|nr:hypothetical protein C8F01DRAFT_359375 [Mycena amicta]
MSKLRRSTSATDLLSRPRSLNREWRRSNKSGLPKYDSLPRLRLLPIGQRPIFICPSPKCGFIHFFADLPLCPWCKGRSDEAVRAYERSTPRPRTRSELIVRWLNDDRKAKSSEGSSVGLAGLDCVYEGTATTVSRRQTISGFLDRMDPASPSARAPLTSSGHKRSHSAPNVQLRARRQPIYALIRPTHSPNSMRTSSPTASTSASQSLVFAPRSDQRRFTYVATGSESCSGWLPRRPISESEHSEMGPSHLFSAREAMIIEQDTLIFEQGDILPDPHPAAAQRFKFDKGGSLLGAVWHNHDDNSVAVDPLLEVTEIESNSSESRSSPAASFTLAPQPAPLPPPDSDNSSSSIILSSPAPTRRRGSIAGLFGSISAKRQESQRRAELAATVAADSNGEDTGTEGSRLGLRTLKRLIRRRWSVGSAGGSR